MDSTGLGETQGVELDELQAREIKVLGAEKEEDCPVLFFYRRRQNTIIYCEAY